MAWRRRSWDLRASAIAASASARLRRISSRSERVRDARGKRGLRGNRPARARALPFRFLAFRDPKPNFTRPNRAQWAVVLGQVSERKVILGDRARQDRALRTPRARLSCLFARRKRARWRARPVASSQSGREVTQKRALSMNQFRPRVRLHTGSKRASFRARILVNAGYGYRTVKNRAGPRQDDDFRTTSLDMGIVIPGAALR